MDRILEKVVRKVAAELRRLFYCVKAFSDSGALQAKADMIALSRACQSLTGRQENPHDPFAEADKMIHSSSSSSNRHVREYAPSFLIQLKIRSIQRNKKKSELMISLIVLSYFLDTHQ